MIAKLWCITHLVIQSFNAAVSFAINDKWYICAGDFPFAGNWSFGSELAVPSVGRCAGECTRKFNDCGGFFYDATTVIGSCKLLSYEKMKLVVEQTTKNGTVRRLYVVNPCHNNNPCDNDGTCRFIAWSHATVCQCQPGFTGTHCEQSVTQKVVGDMTTAGMVNGYDCVNTNPCYDGSPEYFPYIVNTHYIQCPTTYSGCNVQSCSSGMVWNQLRSQCDYINE